MRQLNATGWMHNRLRMIVASFLTKDLRLDWRAGERYFMSQLIDGDRRRITAAGSGRLQRAPTPRPISAYLTPPPGEKFDKQGCLYVAGCRSWQRCRRRPCISRGRGRINKDHAGLFAPDS